MDSRELPFLVEPHDAIRDGLATLKDRAAEVHPVENIQARFQIDRAQNDLAMTRNVYGAGLPARMQIENQILQRFERLPGLPSSHLGLQSLTGELDSFTFDSYLGRDDPVDPPVDMHSAMEQKLGMHSTKPLRRGTF